mgnify:CR=1 FL=1
MKKKVFLLSVAASVLFAGVASAASVWGTYKGKDIIRLTVDGTPVKVSDAPAVAMDGRTMIPIYLLQQAGVSYSWDSKTQTVDITKKDESTNVNLTSLARDIQSQRQFIRIMDQLDLLSACIDIVKTIRTDDEIKKANEQLNRIDVDTLRLFLNKEFIEYYNYSNIIDQIEKGKDSLFEWDTDSAWNYYVSGKSSLNNIYTSLDNRITEHMMSIYSETNK